MERCAKLELLAPAGSPAAFEAAVRAGADAVYVGAPALNARTLARDFNIPEIAAMIDYAARRGVKLYIAVNSLVREDERRQAVQTLARLGELKPAALIIQDLGIYRLARKYFPGLRLHASTLMGAHNSEVVRRLGGMGFSRVVLARELTLREIERIRQASGVELEVFIHGALCFSYSGLCLFSSYLGGKSGLRGRCVQPCRRRYSWRGSRKGKKRPGGGYFFSMNDLCGLGQLPDLQRAGVTSVKIEGRLRNARYVDRVVRAYRQLIDALEEGGEAVEEALAAGRELVAGALGRRTTSAYFTTPRPEDAVTPAHSGNIGIFLGKISGISGTGLASLHLKEQIRAGDRLRLHHEGSGNRTSFTLKSLMSNGGRIDRAPAGRCVEIRLPVDAAAGDCLFKVDDKERRLEALGTGIEPARFRAKGSTKAVRATVERIMTDCCARGRAKATKARPVKRTRSAGRPVDTVPALWLKTDRLQLLKQLPSWKPAGILVVLDRQTAGQLDGKAGYLKRIRRDLILSLPPVILEKDLDFYAGTVGRLLRNGYRRWQLASLGQLSFFDVPGKVELFGDHTLNPLNSLSLAALLDLGFAGQQLPVETDGINLRQVCKDRPPGLKLGLTVYGRPALFTSRLHSPHFHYNRCFVSPRKEVFRLRKEQGLTVALPEDPFSLLTALPELAGAGLDYAVVDLSRSPAPAREMAGLARQIAGARPKRRAATFNYYGKLE